MSSRSVDRDIINALFGEGIATELATAIECDFRSRPSKNLDLQMSVAGIFMNSPKTSEQFYSGGGKEGTDLLKSQCESISILGRNFISENYKMLEDISKHVPGFISLYDGSCCFMSGYEAIRKEDEKNFLDRASDSENVSADTTAIGNVKKRMKLLAALEMARKCEDISEFLASDAANPVAYKLFAYIRSMVQFLFFEFYADGISMQINRGVGGKTKKDRTGIESLIRGFLRDNPQVEARGSVVWRAIKKDLLTNGLKTFDNEYGVEFERDINQDSHYSGNILQTDRNDKKYRMSYEAFKPFFNQLKNEGDS